MIKGSALCATRHGLLRWLWGLGTSIACLLACLLPLGCSQERAPAPKPLAVTTSPSSVVQAVAPAPAPAPSEPTALPLELVTDLVFKGEQLVTCDEIQAPPELVAKLLAGIEKAEQGKPASENEIVRRGQSCSQATSGKPHQASCAKSFAKGAQIVSYYYDAAQQAGSDADMRKCLKEAGTWARNDSDEARHEAAQQQLAKAQRALRKLGAE